ncbi:MAG TPA: hypothetical protein VGP07_12425 [Polyangia bacterium]|jgi:hypothetical protein
MKRTLLGFGLASLVAVAFTAGCSSSGSSVSGSGGSNGNGSGGSNNSGSGGSNNNGSGGSSNGSGGSNSNGSGGSNSSGSGGSSSSGGSDGSGSGGAAAACVAPSAALIDDFSTGGPTPYLGADMGLTAPTVDTSSGALVITFATGMASTMYPYAYVGLGLPACTDASAYTSVTFNISGTLSDGCTIQFSAVDKEHNLVKDGGTCTASSCYASSKVFTLSSSATDVTVNFLDQSGGGADASAAVVDPTQLTGVQWQINVPATGDGCTGTVTIDNVTFK